MGRRLTQLAESRLTFAASIVVLVLTGLFQLYGGPTPYRDVSLLRYTVSEQELRFVATFEKTGCVFQRLRVVGSSAGETEFLAWRDLDNLPEDENRGEGMQTLRLAVRMNRAGYDWIEIRTRHDCDGNMVDKVFLRFDNVP